MAAPGLALKPGLRQRQAQIMTPAMQEAVRLLRLSGLALDAAVREALETNPLLMLEEAPDDSPFRPPTLPVRSPAAGYRPTAAAIRLFGGAAGAAPAGAGSTPPGPAGPDAAALAADRSLHDILFEEIAWSFADPAERRIALDLGGLLDEAGYLAGDPADVAAAHGVGTAQVERILARLQALAPPGLFARDLAECLRLQLADAGRLDPPMTAILDHLPLLTERGPEALAAAAGIDPDDLPACLDRLRALDPRPGLALAGGPAPTIVPDLLVLAADAAPAYDRDLARPVGRWIVALNPDTVPRVTLDRAGLAGLRARSRDAATRTWLNDRSRDAALLIRAIERRGATMLEVGAEIFSRQQAFLEHGMAALGPMKRRDIADAVGLNESTVGRAAQDKFAATPQGTFALTALFSARIGDLNGGAGHAAGAVRHRLRTLIGAEAAALSDAALTRMLRAEGYDISRRTVAKYRGVLRIPSSVGRRRRAGRSRRSAAAQGD